MATDRLADRSVIGRSFAILDAFANDIGVALSLSELARRTRMPKSSLHRLASQLVRVGALDRSGGRYRLGLKLFELGSVIPIHRRLREAALPFLMDLYEATHQVVHLGVRDGTDVLYLERIVGHQSGPCPTKVGGRKPLYCTGLGKALLAFSGEQVQGEILRTRPRPFTPRTIVVPEVLEQELAMIRSSGVAFDREETQVGLVCVGAPVLIDGKAVAALSIAGPAHGTNVDRLAGAVRTAAISVSRVIASDPRLMR